MGLDKVPPALSLSITFGILAAGVLWSAWKTRRARKEDVPAVG
jgi:tellurite resistance protein TerC